MGPLLLVQAGVRLVDAPGEPLFDRVSRRRRDHAARRGRSCAPTAASSRTGELMEPAAVASATDERRREIGEALEAFAQNTVEHMREERELLAGRLELPRFAHRLPRPPRR